MSIATDSRKRDLRDARAAAETIGDLEQRLLEALANVECSLGEMDQTTETAEAMRKAFDKLDDAACSVGGAATAARNARRRAERAAGLR